MKEKTILAIGAHIGDAELTAGARSFAGPRKFQAGPRKFQAFH